MKRILILGMVLFFMTSCSSKPSLKTGSEAISVSEQTNSLWNEDTIDESLISENEILNDNQFSVEFWVKPEANKIGTVLFSLGDEDNYIQCITLGDNEEVEPIQYSGISLQAKKNNQVTWLIADGIDTIQTGKYNQVIVQFNAQQAVIYLNGQKVAQGELSRKSIANSFRFGRGFDQAVSVVGKVSDLKLSNELKTAEEVKVEYDRNAGKIALDAIQFSDADDLTQGLYLLNYSKFGVPITWESDRPDVLDTNLTYMPQAEDTLVTMTATVDVEGVEKVSKDFTFMVKAVSVEVMFDRDSKICDVSIQKVMHSGTILPLWANYSMVDFEVIAGEGKFWQSKLIKTSEEESAQVTVKATLSYGGHEREILYDVLLLDEVGGYILSYFEGNEGEETGRLAYSTDGLNWKNLNQGNSIITSDLGTKRIRDPFITRDIEGEFVILATEGFDNPSIYLMRSPDLIDYSNQNLVRLSYFDEGLQMDGTRAWAPEMRYDMKTNQYIITFSNPSDLFVGETYAVTTTDLEQMSYPFSLFAPGYEVIDATIITMADKYWLFYKDEREGAKTVFYASSDELLGNYSTFDQQFLFADKNIEGPFVVQKPYTNYLYVDHYPSATFYVAEFYADLDGIGIHWLWEDEYSFPTQSIRHGSSLPVTAKELERLIEYYN